MIIMNEKIVFSDLYFINSEKMGDFIREMNNIHNRRKTGSITDQEHDILAYCPLKPRNYLINQVIGEKLEIEFTKTEDLEMYGEKAWIPFLAKYLIGEFQAIDNMNQKWGVRFDGKGGYKTLVAETRMVEQ